MVALIRAPTQPEGVAPVAKRVGISAPMVRGEGSVMIDAVPTDAAAIAMRSRRKRMKWRAGDIFYLSSRRRPGPITTGFAVLDGGGCQYRKTISIWGNGSRPAPG